MDRSIPHIRNIFSHTSSRRKSDSQDLCQREKSPRPSRKKSGSKDPTTPNKENLNYGTYTSKSLTEKDMKHLERHLSMKKTIRKQISRNLAQAFLDQPDGDRNVPDRIDHTLPLLGAGQNVLAMLKTGSEERDSGHSNPTDDHPLGDSDCEGDVGSWVSRGHRGSDTKGLMSEDKPKDSEKKTSSIWKVFSPRHKNKR